MKRFIRFCFIALCLTILCFPECSIARSKRNAEANYLPGIYVPGDVYVRAHTKKNGTHVGAHRRSQKNSSEHDNWSTIGNVNPYNGKKGTRKPRW